jgi:hypothetical protein
VELFQQNFYLKAGFLWFAGLFPNVLFLLRGGVSEKKRSFTLTREVIIWRFKDRKSKL